MPIKLVSLALMAVVLAGIWSIGGDGLTVSRIPEAASHSISARNDPATICEGNRDLRARVTEANLHRLAKGTNLDALLAARWEQRRQTAIRQFEDRKQGHFPGFLEGDLGLHVPFFWGACLFEALV